MNVYFHTLQTSLHEGIRADYMSDLLFHGLKSLPSVNLEAFPSKIHLYKGYNIGRLWGRGFSYAGLLDRAYTDLGSHIDIYVCSIHHTLHHYPNETLQTLKDIKSKLQPNTKMAVVDGNDLTNWIPEVFTITPYYFKREIADNADERLIPIHFALPKEKIVAVSPIKSKNFAFIHPGSCESHWPNDSRKTHIYTDEASYYKDYQEARFAYTCKKGGWDCMRHYEILGNACVPLFTDIEDCPRRTLTNLPKTLLSEAKRISGLVMSTTSNNKFVYGGHHIIQGQSSINQDEFNLGQYQEIQNALFDYTKKYLTTEALAKYFLNQMEIS